MCIVLYTDEPHSGNPSVSEPHSGNMNVSEPHSGNTHSTVCTYEALHYSEALHYEVSHT